MVVKLEDAGRAAGLFDGWQETLIWSCLQKQMGAVYADDIDRPAAAMALLGDFCFFAGQPSGELVEFKPEECEQEFIIMVPQSGEWADMIAGYYAIEEELFGQCLANDWSRDLVSQFKGYEMYRKMGLGMAVLKDRELVAGASSYARYIDGIEIEIDTKGEFRRQGLAYACGAGLILQCLERGLYPSWDAQNKWSVALAEKLGYQYDHAYLAYEVWGY